MMLSFCAATAHAIRVLWGVCVYCGTGRTPGIAYQSMVRLFCISGGWTNRCLSALLRRRASHTAEAKAKESSLVGIHSENMTSIHAALLEDGCIVIPNAIDSGACDRIMGHILRCRGRYQGDAVAGDNAVREFDRSAPLGTKFSIDTVDLLAAEEIQKLVRDEAVLAIARAYLRAEPVIDIVTAWWSTVNPSGPDSEAAQLFHFDMDRPRWLKMFLYLTDVTSDTGPHVFVPGTHRDNGIPRHLRNRGYVRLPDDDVVKFFPRPEWKEIVGTRGTVILEDTRGLHKGMPLIHGDRLLVQVEYTSSLFGGAVQRIRYDPVRSPLLASAVRASPYTYSLFESQNPTRVPK